MVLSFFSTGAVFVADPVDKPAAGSFKRIIMIASIADA
jgi:hypothetical protein